MAQLLESGDPKEFQLLDETCLAGKSFLVRADLYARAAKLASETPFASGKLVGLKGEQLDKFLNDRAGSVRADMAAYTGKLTNEAVRVVAYHLKLVEKAQSDAFFAAYLAEAQKQMTADGGFPLVRDLSRMATVDKFMAAGKQLKYISEDLVSPVFQKYGLRDRPDSKAFVAGIEGQQAVARALLGDEGILGVCTIILAGSTEATRSKDQWRGTWRDIKLICDGCTSDTPRTESETDQKIGEAPVAPKLELKLIKNVNSPDSPSFPIATGDWGPLWLIHKYKGEIDKSDPQKKTWLVEFPVAAPEATGSLRLKLKFERPLPELEKWPGR
jgi:hypothetical protein